MFGYLFSFFKCKKNTKLSVLCKEVININPSSKEDTHFKTFSKHTQRKKFLHCILR